MWECPKCRRVFKNSQQSHYSGKAPETIEEYIAAQPEHAQDYLHRINDAVKSALPDAEPAISWSMPTYKKGCNLIQFAANKNHIGIYAGAEAVTAFQESLSEYETDKGTIRFRYDEPLPAELIADIARWCGDNA